MLKKVMEDRVLWSLAVGSHVLRTVKDASTVNTGNIQLSVIEDGFPEPALNNIIKELVTNKIILQFYLL